MSCNNCMNGCVTPQMCSCDCTTCAEANSCDIPVGDTGATGPQGPGGPPGTNGSDGTNGTPGVDGCNLTDVYISDGTDGNVNGDIIVTTGTAAPCPNVINAGNLIASIVAEGSAVPSGLIVMWHGALVNIPIGWVHCDGLNSTPDLRGRMIGAFGPNPITHAPYNGINATGGSNTISLAPNQIPAHVHGVGGYTVSSVIPASGAHRHTVQAQNSGSGSLPNSCRRTVGNNNSPGIMDNYRTGTNETSPQTGTDEADHTHPVNSTLGGTSADGTPSLSAPLGAPTTIIPKYHVLAFIMKQ